MRDIIAECRPVVLGFLVFCISGCCSYQKCIDRYGSAYVDTVTVDTVLRVQGVVPGDSISLSLPIFSIKNFQDTLIRQGRAKAGFKVRTDTLVIEMACEPDTIYKEIPVRFQLPCPERPVFKPPQPKWYQELWQDYKQTAAVLLPILIIGFLIIDRLIR